ncbi:hypothetical protein SNEBB_009855 [Seison nebaliae]|nr:hypothetical protein SNEBB_009855 [Seison nebaliae]
MRRFFHTSTNRFISLRKSRQNNEEFTTLDVKRSSGQGRKRIVFTREAVPPDRSLSLQLINRKMDWTDVWPSAAAFKQSLIPFPIRMGYVEKKNENNGVPPSKYGNKELMKIQNFLHLTPQHIKKHCDVLKKFCVPFPEELKGVNVQNSLFPLRIQTTNYVFGSTVIREPKSRIVSIKFPLKSLNLPEENEHKFLRLIGFHCGGGGGIGQERTQIVDDHTPKTRMSQSPNYKELEKLQMKIVNGEKWILLISSRCPRRQQNQEYLLYLLAATYHESLKKESWEESEFERADWHQFIWEKSPSKDTFEKVLKKRLGETSEMSREMFKKNYQKTIENIFRKTNTIETMNDYKDLMKKIIHNIIYSIIPMHAVLRSMNLKRKMMMNRSLNGIRPTSFCSRIFISRIIIYLLLVYFILMDIKLLIILRKFPETNNRLLHQLDPTPSSKVSKFLMNYQNLLNQTKKYSKNIDRQLILQSRLLRNFSFSNVSSSPITMFHPLSIKRLMVAEMTQFVRSPASEIFEDVTHFARAFPWITPNYVSFFGCILSVIVLRMMSTTSFCIQQMAVILYQLRNYMDSYDGVVFRTHMKMTENSKSATTKSSMNQTTSPINNKKPIGYQSFYNSNGYFVDATSDAFGGICFCVSLLLCLLKMRQKYLNNSEKISRQSPVHSPSINKSYDIEKSLSNENDDSSSDSTTKDHFSYRNLTFRSDVEDFFYRSTQTLRQTVSWLMPKPPKLENVTKAYVFQHILLFGLRIAITAILWDKIVRQYSAVFDYVPKPSKFSPSSNLVELESFLIYEVKRENYMRVQAKILQSATTLTIVFFWRISSAIALLDYLAAAIFINRSWPFVIKTSRIGWIFLISLWIISIFHLSHVTSILNEILNK